VIVAKTTVVIIKTNQRKAMASEGRLREPDGIGAGLPRWRLETGLISSCNFKFSLIWFQK
jgi:hypothetical protein